MTYVKVWRHHITEYRFHDECAVIEIFTHTPSFTWLSAMYVLSRGEYEFLRDIYSPAC